MGLHEYFDFVCNYCRYFQLSVVIIYVLIYCVYICTVDSSSDYCIRHALCIKIDMYVHV